MPLSEQDEKRLHELVIQLEIVHDSIWSLLSPFKKGKVVFLTLEQMKELKELFNHEKKLTDEFMAIPYRMGNQP